MSRETGDEQLIEIAERMTKAFRELDATLKGKINASDSTNNNQTISVNAGGPAVWFAVWLASICCAVMLTLSMVSHVDQIDQRRKLDLANDKLSVILQWSPELAKKVDDQISKQEKERKP